MGAGYGGGGVHCSFTSCLPTLCPLLPRITPRLLKICHDVGVVVLWCCGGGVDQRGPWLQPSSAPAPHLQQRGVVRHSAALRRAAGATRMTMSE